MSSKDAYRSSAGRVAHCRLACIRVVIVFPFGCLRAGVPSTPSARTDAQPGGRYLLQATDSLGDVLMPLQLCHALQAMGDGEGSVSERAFRGHSRDPGFLRSTEHGAPDPRLRHAAARARTNSRTWQSSGMLGE